VASSTTPNTKSKISDIHGWFTGSGALKVKIDDMHTQVTDSSGTNLKKYVDDMHTQVTNSSGTNLKKYVDEIYVEVASSTTPNTKSKMSDIHGQFTGSGALKVKIDETHTQVTVSSGTNLKKYIDDMHTQVTVSSSTNLKKYVDDMHNQVTNSTGTNLKKYVDQMYVEVASSTTPNTKSKISDIHGEVTSSTTPNTKSKISDIHSQVTDSSGTNLKKYVDDMHYQIVIPLGTEFLGTLAWEADTSNPATINDAIASVTSSASGGAISTANFGSTGTHSWRVVLNGVNVVTGETRGLNLIKIGVKSSGTSSPPTRSWHTLSSKYDSNLVVLRGSKKNTFCNSECIVELTMDLDSSPKLLTFALIKSGDALFEGRAFLIASLPDIGINSWRPWVHLTSSGDETSAMFL